MRQSLRRQQITDGVDAGFAGAHHLVHLDEASIVESDTGALETDVLGHRPPTHGDQ